MPTTRLDVPVAAQEKANCCGHASACMNWLYWQQSGKGAGRMNTVASKYAVADSTGLYPAEFITLAQKVRLYKLCPNPQVTEADLFAILRAGGPIWSAGYWFGCGRIVVVTGVDKGEVYFNAPDQGVKNKGAISGFNEKLARLPGCMMIKDPGAC